MSTPGTRPGIVRITRIEAAIGQLETAIFLWFQEGDLAAIHTLAAASQELLHHTGKRLGTPSKLVEMINSEPKKFRDRVRQAQNFFKHPKDHPILSYAPIIAELTIIDALAVVENMNHPLSPIMKLFAIRFALTHPNILPLDFALAKFPIGLDVNQIGKLSRPDFLEKILPLIGG
ncbi:MAG: hypothetical protein ABR611_15455 [Chthoniobacterales bacterium]